MAIEKALYELPQGLEAAAASMEPLEIEIENPESVTIGLDGLEIKIEPEEESADDFDANLAEYLNDGELAEIAGDLLGDIDSDIGARKEWMQTYTNGIKLLGMKIKEKTKP